MTVKGLAKSGLISGARLLRPLVQRLASRHASIFMLHRFCDDPLGSAGTTPEHLARCLEELRRRRFSLVTVDEAVAAAQSGHPLHNAVAFTIDDGYADQAEIGSEVLARYDCPATFYLITDFIDGNWWPLDARTGHIFQHSPLHAVEWESGGARHLLPLPDWRSRWRAWRKVTWLTKSLPLEQATAAINDLARCAEVDLPAAPPAAYSPMTWEQARALEARGHRIGAHSRRHTVLSSENDTVAGEEIRGSLAALEREVAQPSTVFCYPTGRWCDFNERDRGIIRDAGFSAALSAEPGYFAPNQSDLYAIPRFSFPATIADFRQTILYVEYLKDKFRRRSPAAGSPAQPVTY